MNSTVMSDLAHQAGLLDAVCDVMPAAIIVYDRNDQLIYASRQVLNFFPIPAHHLQMGTRLRDFLGALYDNGMKPHPGADPSRPVLSRDEWLAEGIASHWRERAEMVERYGFDRWIRMVKRRLPAGWGICVMTDVTEHKKREEAWRVDLERVQATEDILDNFPFPVFVKDHNLVYIAANRAFCQVRGLAAEQLLGKTVFDVMPHDLAMRFDQTDRQVLETGSPQTTSERLINEDGVEQVIIKRKVRVGHPGRYLVVTAMADISDVLDSAQAMFFDRSPMLRAGEYDSGHVYEQVVPEAQAGQLPVHAESFIPDRFAGQRVLIVSPDPEIRERNEKLLARLGFDFASLADSEELSTFLATASEVGIAVDLVLIDVEVEIEALEIAKANKVNILAFDRNNPTSELAYELVRHFNSRIPDPEPAVSEEDFEIDTGPVGGSVSLVQVLVAEDNEINQLVYMQILEGLGYSYRLAATGAEVVSLAEDLSPGIILMDTTLPDFDGFEAARRIRQRESGRRVPIIGVLARPMEGDHLACSEAGMDGVLMKPLSPDMVEGVFEHYLAANGQETDGLQSGIAF